MRVGIHREADLAVVERLHHHARVYFLSQQQGGAGMAQVVEADVGKARSLQSLLEKAEGISWVEGRAYCGREDHEFRIFLVSTNSVEAHA